MVGHLVVAREGRVDRGTAFHHVREDAVDDQVADDDAHGRAQERVDPAPVTPRPHVAAPLARRGRDLEEHLPGEEDERPGDVEAVGEKRPVARVGLLLGLEPAHGQDQVVGLSREEVAAARAAVPEQADPRPAPALDLGAVGGRRARHQRPRLLLDPPEGRDVLVGAEEDACLARARLRGEVRLPLGERVRVLREPARHRRGVAVAHRVAQHRQSEAVDLEEEDPGLVGGDALAGPPRLALDRPKRVGVVVVRPDDDLERDADRGRHERDEQGDPERVELDCTFREAVREEEHGGVRKQDEHEAEREGERQAEGRDQRRDDRVQDRDDERDEKRAPESLDFRAPGTT